MFCVYRKRLWLIKSKKVVFILLAIGKSTFNEFVFSYEIHFYCAPHVWDHWRITHTHHPSICATNQFVVDCVNANGIVLWIFQYYEMSYGLNVEMHKQASIFNYNICFYFHLVSPPRCNNVEKSQTFHPPRCRSVFFFLIPLRLCKFLEKGR